MNKKIALFSLVMFVIVGVASFFYLSAKPNIEELKKSVSPAASIYTKAKPLSEKLNFINDDLMDVHLSEITDGKWALLYFGYTSCPDVCPVDLSKINLSYQMMENSKDLQVVFVSVDPQRDVGNLNQFAGAFNSSFKGLTAHQDELMTISKALGVYHEVVESQKLAQQDHSNHGDHGEHSSETKTNSHDNHSMGHNDEFMVHEMINPENGDVQKVENHERHMELMKLGYVHHGHDMATNKDSHEMVADDEHSSTEMAHYDIDHTSSYLLFSPDLKLTALLTSPHNPMPMAEALDKIIDTLGQD
ncbi:MAG: SCO family protein [Thiotrichales bacterium]|nr:SCO family protein [Thiotrichales bacterium]